VEIEREKIPLSDEESF